MVNGFNICVTRDGQGKMTAPFQATTGNAGAPSVTFQGATSSGLYSSTASQVGIAGGLLFGNTGSGIQADMSNGTQTSRWFLQTSTTNANSAPSVLPNGTASTAFLAAYNNSVPTNAGAAQFGVSSTVAFINSTVSGSGTQLPLQFQIAGTSYGQITTAGLWSINAGAFTPTVVVTYGTTTTINCALGNAFRVVFGAGNITTLTVSNPSDGQAISIRFKQDATGGRTIAWPASFRWNGGLAPVLSTAANAIDLLSATYDATDATYVCSLLKGVQ